MRFLRGGRGLLAASALCLIAPAAHADDCSTLSHVVYVAGSTAAKPFIAAVAAALKAEATPINLVYSGQGSCIGVGTMAATNPGTIMGTASTFSGTGIAPVENATGCTLDPAGTTVDIGVSDVYAKTCEPSIAVAADVKDFHGPVQSMNLVVPKDSTQVSISSEAAYLTFGLGADAGNGVPWNDPTVHEVRGATSGTMLMTGSVIGLAATKWKGTAQADTAHVLTALGTDVTNGNTQKAIGIMSSGDADKNRSAVRGLAFQPVGSSCGYTPDSDSTTSFDKANTRDGHYVIAGPAHLYAHAPSGTVANADVKKVIDYITGAVDPDFDLIAVEAKASVVPDCAMRVSNTVDGGPLASYMPPKSCECKFVAAATGTAPASCKTCVMDSDCKSSSAPKCNYGYCEVK
ncbi:MAG TPA: hypothetical protein VH062_11045 [Polyangiaceae bacterium]|nr:hypothetical protein [Polyangiaceae bacterium]